MISHGKCTKYYFIMSLLMTTQLVWDLSLYYICIMGTLTTKGPDVALDGEEPAQTTYFCMMMLYWVPPSTLK